MKGSYIYVTNSNNKQTIAEKRYIEEGPTYEDQTMVLSGLNPKDEVIITGYDQVSNGVPVEIK